MPTRDAAESVGRARTFKRLTLRRPDINGDQRSPLGSLEIITLGTATVVPADRGHYATACNAGIERRGPRFAKSSPPEL